MADERELSGHIQDSIAYLAITSSDFLKLVRNFVDTELFSSDVVHIVMRACYKYFDLTKEAPGDHICDIIADEIKSVPEAKRELVTLFLDRVSQMREPNAAYVTTKLNEFVKSRTFQMAAVEFVKLIDHKRFSEAELLMYNALKSGVRSLNVGCDYFVDFSTMYGDHEESLVSMGLVYFDSYRQFHRSELGVVLGGYKGKKSYTLHHIGVRALVRGLNVLHVSHENSQDICERRYDRMVGSLVDEKDRGIAVPVRSFNHTAEKVEVVMVKRPCISDAVERKKARATLHRFGGRLIIKKFPMGSCDMRELERYLDQLEQFESFVPDVLLNDYPDIQKPLDSSKQVRDQLNETYIYHKRLADERNMLVVVPSQATRAAIRAKRITMKDFAEDVRKLANCDWTIAVCQTDVQATSGLGSLYVVAARDGLMDVGCGLVLNLETGHFATDSFPLRAGVLVADESEEQSNSE